MGDVVTRVTSHRTGSSSYASTTPSTKKPTKYAIVEAGVKLGVSSPPADASVAFDEEMMPGKPAAAACKIAEMLMH